MEKIARGLKRMRGRELDEKIAPAGTGTGTGREETARWDEKKKTRVIEDRGISGWLQERRDENRESGIGREECVCECDGWMGWRCSVLRML
jgi:hypothetical protein